MYANRFYFNIFLLQVYGGFFYETNLITGYLIKIHCQLKFFKK